MFALMFPGFLTCGENNNNRTLSVPHWSGSCKDAETQLEALPKDRRVPKAGGAGGGGVQTEELRRQKQHSPFCLSVSRRTAWRRLTLRL